MGYNQRTKGNTMILPLPYIFSNPKWYYYDSEIGRYRPTDDAPPDAVDSLYKCQEAYDNEDDTIEYKIVDWQAELDCKWEEDK